MKRRDFIRTGAMATMGLIVGCSVRNRFDLVIKNGTILDGTGSEALKRDIGIVDEKIATIDDLKTATSDLAIDATGLVVSPGFIDVHSHTDWELLINPKAESKIRQGVTTEVSGNCGYSCFPLNDLDFAELDDEFFDIYGLRLNWRDLEGFLRLLEKRDISINYATLIGHGSLRSFVVGRNDLAATPEQLSQMRGILERSLQKGVFGLSTGLGYAPGSYASTEELVELCEVVSDHEGIYATHMRSEGDEVEEAIQEAVRICEEAEVSLQISHLKLTNESNWPKIDRVLEMIQQAADSGLPVNADRYPYIAWSTGLSGFLPLWSRQGSNEEVLARLQDQGQLSIIKEHVENRGRSIGGWDRVVIGSCVSEQSKIWEGKSIRECARTVGRSPFEFIRTILIEEENRVNVVGFAMHEDNLKRILSSPWVMVASDGSAVAPYGKLARGKPHPRLYGTFPRVLGKYCREEKLFDLATAVKKMTSMPAAKFGLQKRGIIAEGYYGDLTIFDPDKVIDKATFTDPHQFPAGIEYVIVNGKLSIKNGNHTGAGAGRLLKRKVS